jgi:hypothetical protein
MTFQQACRSPFGESGTTPHGQPGAGGLLYPGLGAALCPYLGCVQGRTEMGTPTLSAAGWASQSPWRASPQPTSSLQQHSTVNACQCLLLLAKFSKRHLQRRGSNVPERGQVCNIRHGIIQHLMPTRPPQASVKSAIKRKFKRGHKHTNTEHPVCANAYVLCLQGWKDVYCVYSDGRMCQVCIAYERHMPSVYSI